MIVNEFEGMENIAKNLSTSLKVGIEEDSIKSRIEAFGKNAFPPPKIKSVWELIMENFEDTIN